jgi:two-component system chemotaxis response regulator CheB
MDRPDASGLRHGSPARLGQVLEPRCAGIQQFEPSGGESVGERRRPTLGHRDIIAIGGSLGSIDAIRTLCGSFSPELAASVFIVVHVGAHGNDLLAGIFDSSGPISASTAVDGEPLRRGHAYVAPADHHLLVMDDVVRLGRGPRENMARPAIDPLFRSVGVSFGPRAIGVVLTGMLNDGAAGLADLKRCGGTTVVQSPAGAVAPEMPLGALRGSDIDYRASIGDLGALLVELTRQEAGPAVAIPEDIPLEVEIALGHRADSSRIEQVADAVPLSCPACGGVLSEIRRRPPVRFRCQVGHAYTLDALAEEQEGTVDEAVRVALRIIEERAVLGEKMAEDARLSGRHAAAADSEERSREHRKFAGILRRAIDAES